MVRATSRRCRKTLSPAELARFLDALARTGNFALACVSLGRARSGLYKRRKRDPAFAARCAAALAEFRLSVRVQASLCPGERERGRGTRTAPGELRFTDTRFGPQLRRSPAGCLTQAGVARFLETLAATANVRLAAASVGLAHSSIYARRRRDPAFAQAMRAALHTGYARIEAAILQAANTAFDDKAPLPAAGEGGLAQGEPGEGTSEITAPISFHDALMLLNLHRRQVRDGWATMRKPVESATTAEIARALERRLRTFRVEDVPKED